MMTNNNFSGTKTFIRRFFKQDIESVLNLYKQFDTLFYNPMSAKFADEILLYGEFWGAYIGNKLIGCCYFFNADSDFFKKYETHSFIADFIPNMQNYYYFGYIAVDDNYDVNEMYKSFYTLVQLQAYKNGIKYVLHCVPAKMSSQLQLLLNCDFKLIRMRGLDNLVVHYIFVKSIFSNDERYAINKQSPQIVQLENTKTLSKYLEHGFCGVELFCNDGQMLMQLKKLSNL